jgi:protease-4
LQEALVLAEADPLVKGLVLRVRSPGGGVAASETLHHLLATWKARSHKPMVAYLQGMATSGGYYIAVASDHVIAHPSTITGSIGVIMPGYNVAGLMDRFGVVDQSLTSGAFKDSGSSTRPMREEERAQLQSVIDDLYRRFVDVVDAGRPKLDRFAVELLADGRIYTANQALEAGLIDEIGHMDAAIDRLKKLVGTESVKLVTYKPTGATPKNIYSDFANRAPTQTEINLFSIGGLKIPAGFYYLWPAAVAR